MSDRKVKIVATIGPACQDEKVMEDLFTAGLDVARLNFSHGSHAEHTARYSLLRSISKRRGLPLAIMQDLQGPKIRVGLLDDPLVLLNGQKAFFYPEKVTPPSFKDNRPGIPVDFPQLFDSVKPGNVILLDDGRLSLKVIKVSKQLVEAEVTAGGTLLSNKGINLPGVRFHIPGFTDKDALDLQVGLELGVDAVAISFVTAAQDVILVKEEIKKHNPANIPFLVAKLERPEALENIESILEEVDGVMVARGDLGVEMAPEDVPGAQKQIIRQANRKGKLVITATQMLESMIHNSIPTRAEASDVANAVYDGTDAVMLSAETAAGDFPVQSVSMMNRIVCEAESNFSEWGHTQLMDLDDKKDSIALTRAASELARDQDVKAIAVFTSKGSSALMMAKARPRVPILAFTPDQSTFQKLAFAWGVQPLIVPFVDTVEGMFGCVEESLRNSGKVTSGQQVVLVCGFPIGEMRPPNMVLLHTLS